MPVEAILKMSFLLFPSLKLHPRPNGPPCVTKSASSEWEGALCYNDSITVLMVPTPDCKATIHKMSLQLGHHCGLNPRHYGGNPHKAHRYLGLLCKVHP